MFDHVPSPPDHGLLQDPAFAAALRALGQPPLHLPDGLMILKRRVLGVPMLMLPRAVPPRTLDAQLHMLGLQRLPLILSPEEPCALPVALCLRRAQTRAVLDLSTGQDHRRAALHGKWRNALKRAEKSGLKIRRTHLPPDPNHPLLLGELQQARARGYANWPATLTAAFAAAAPTQAQLFTAKLGHEEVAQTLFLRHGAQASYHIGLTSNMGKACGAHNLLLWRAANWLADSGCHTLNLGLIHRATPGLNRFKRRMGAELRQTGGTWLRWTPLARGGHP